MDKLNLPDYSPLLRVNQTTRQILDPVRRKYVALTPEEWVRQNLVQHLLA